MQTQPQQTEPSFTAAEVELFVVPRDQVDYAWPEIARCISRVRATAWNLDDVKYALEQGHAQAFGLRDGKKVLGFWITRIEKTYSKKYGLVWIVAGDGLAIGEPFYRETIEPWFWSQGCDWIEVNGRKGWLKILPDYYLHSVVLRKYREIHPSHK